MHLVSCTIDLAGDPQQVVVRGSDRPVAWTEIPILQAIHGYESVYNVDVVGFAPNPPPQEEKLRLASIYGEEVTAQVYPGFRPNFEWDMPGIELPPGFDASFSATPPDDEDEASGGDVAAEADPAPSAGPPPPSADDVAYANTQFGAAFSAAAEARKQRADKQGRTGAFRRTPDKRMPPPRGGS